MAYTTIDDPSAYFQTKLYTGNASTQSITFDGNTNMQPDWVWIKSRTNTEYHNLVDSIRGNTKYLYSNSAEAEATDAQNNRLTSFDSNGFSLGADENANDNNENFASWNWKAGTSFSNDASSTGIGSIDSAGSVNETAGFSICTYTGISSAGTIKHGLSTVPSMIIWKNRSASNGWITYHHKNTSAPETDYLELHSTNATADLDTIMADTAPTSSVFSIGTEGAVGGGNTNNFVAYIFSERQGYSKFGSYEGTNNANGTFVYTGFSVGWVMIKNIDAGSTAWVIQDSKRSSSGGGNPADKRLRANATNAEETDSPVDLLSNGFKIRSTGSFTSDANTFIYMAFAENPFTTSTGVPATAR